MNVLFRRGDQTFIDNNVPLNDGQIIFNETDEAIYVDNTINGTVVRKRYGGGNLSRSDIDMAFSTTSENPIANKVVTNAIGTLSNLTTDAKTNLVVAVNEVDAHANTAINNANTNASHIGTLSNLTTTAKNNLVSAVNEVDNHTDIIQAQVSNSSDTYSSTKAYAVGDLCIYNNVLYRCTTACSAGSWTTNQSCFTADTLTNCLNIHNLGNIALSNCQSYSRLTAYRQGNIIILVGTSVATLTDVAVGGSMQIATLPNSLTPLGNIINSISNTIGGKSYTGELVIQPDSKVFIRNLDNASSSSKFYSNFQILYIIA